jgi:ACS family hexuronate transporter-like MFS transporter
VRAEAARVRRAPSTPVKESEEKPRQAEAFNRTASRLSSTCEYFSNTKRADQRIRTRVRAFRRPWCRVPSTPPISGPARFSKGSLPYPDQYDTSGARLNLGLTLVLLSGVFALSSGDRAILPVLKTTLSEQIHLTNQNYGSIVGVFMASYTLAYLFVGRIVHRLGPRNTLAFSVLQMSAAVALSGSATGPAQLGAALVLLGTAQACVMPVVTLTIVQRFHAHRHARVYAVINLVQSSATILCPPAVAVVTLYWGWRWAFLFPAFAGLFVAIACWRFPLLPSRSASDSFGETTTAPLGWAALLKIPAARTLMLARAVSDPFWFFFQYWHVAFLREHIGMSLAEIGYWAWIPPLTATCGAFAFALISDRLLVRGDSPERARTRPILWATTLAAAVVFLPGVRSVPMAIALCALAAAMCNTWLSLSAVLMGSLVPRASLPSALGLMSAIGGMSTILLNAVAGGLIEHFGYGATLWCGALLYPIAGVLLARRLLVPAQSGSSATSARTSSV